MSNTQVSTKVTPALHPDNLKALDGYGDDTAVCLSQIDSALSTAYEGIKAVWNAKANASRNPVWNEAQRLIEVDAFASKALTNITQKMDAAMDNLNITIASYEQQLSSPLKQAGSSAIATEIRAHAKSLTEAKRQKFMDNALQERDYTTLSAVLAAPGYLSGLSEAERQTRTRLYHEATAPAVAKRLRVMKAASTFMGERCGLVFSQIEKAVGAPSHKIKALKDAKTQSEAAFILKDGL